MKKLICLSVIILVAFSTVFAQRKLHFDVKFGISPGSKPLNAGLIVNRDNPHEEFVFNMNQVKPQFFGGIRANLQLATPFFLETGLSYTKRTSQYAIDYTMPGAERQSRDTYMSESEDILMLPVDIGVSLGKFDVTSGLTATKTISTIKELSHLKGFKADANGINMGWQMGVRYGINRVLAGVEYQGSLTRVGNGMSVNGHALELMNVPGKMVFSLQYRF